MTSAAPVTPASAELDVAIVAGARPELIARTLASFAARMFGSFDIRRVHANIDPFGGDEAARDDAADLLRDRFGDRLNLRRPDRPSFGGAVRWLWSQAGTRPLLHLEDDWLLLASVSPADVALGPGVGCVTLASAHHGRVPGDFHEREDKTKLWRLTLYRRRVANFGTSPRVLAPRFAAECARLMDPGLDPEKQMRPPHNPALRRFQRGFRARYLRAPDGGPIIEDIGREWRDARGIEKTVRDGRSVWSAP